MVLGQRREPEGELAELRRHRVLVDAVEAALRDLTLGVEQRVLVRRQVGLDPVHLPGLDQHLGELAAGLDQKRPGAHGGVEHPEVENLLGSSLGTEALEDRAERLGYDRGGVHLLIADDVGLGKTIEAGLILRELLLRRRVDLIVVAAPPSMLLQWQDELWTRFGLRFGIMDREFVTRMRRERGFGTNAWATDSRFLISHRLLIDETYAAGLRVRLGRFRPRSLLILDEAHHAAPASGRKYALDSQTTIAIRDLAPRFEHRLFLTATPHNGHPNSFAALMEILDPQRFERGDSDKIEPARLEPVMVRRLKEDLRGLGQRFPERVIEPIVLSGLPDEAPELLLARKLADYKELRDRRLAGESAPRRARAEII